MKIVFQKVAKWDDKPHAEAELALRLLYATKSIRDLEAISSSNFDEIESFEPDIVIPLHFFVPKLFDAFTVGCMWNPSSAINHNNAWDNIKSYDGYGTASDSQEQMVRAIKFKSPSQYLLTRLYPSTNTTSFKKPENFSRPVYIGSGWSKGRHDDFFSIVKNASVYGPGNSWGHLPKGIYQGEIAIDGSSSLKVYHESGIGLSLHDDNHNREGIPSMRPFEIAASSSVMISDHNAFVQSVFGDNALYLDTSLEPAEINDQLNEFTDWIQNHKTQAQEMADACHKIFIEKYSLEKLLENLILDIDQFTNAPPSPPEKFRSDVEIIVRTDGEDKKKLLRALSSIDNQSYKKTTALIVYRGNQDCLSPLQSEIKDSLPELPTKFVSAEKETDRGTQFYTGLRASSAPFIGFLDHDDVLFSDHVSSLLDCLTKYPDAPLAYSGSIRIWEGGNPPAGEQVRKLAYYYELKKNSEFRSCITSNSFIARRESLPWNILNQPIPRMDSRDDYIFLYMIYRTNPYFLFSEKVTSAFYWRATKIDNSAFELNPNPIKIKPFGSIVRLGNTRIDYGESSGANAAEPSNLIISSFVRKIVSTLKNDLDIILTKLKGNRK